VFWRQIVSFPLDLWCRGSKVSEGLFGRRLHNIMGAIELLDDLILDLEGKLNLGENIELFLALF
jgi:hypothetical protein